VKVRLRAVLIPQLPPSPRLRRTSRCSEHASADPSAPPYRKKKVGPRCRAARLFYYSILAARKDLSRRSLGGGGHVSYLVSQSVPGQLLASGSPQELPGLRQAPQVSPLVLAQLRTLALGLG
jgi:hypothetical protein